MESITSIVNEPNGKNINLAREIKYYRDKIKELNEHHKSDLNQLKNKTYRQSNSNH